MERVEQGSANQREHQLPGSLLLPVLLCLCKVQSVGQKGVLGEWRRPCWSCDLQDLRN
jgi:hypothetical protein